jgi:integrase
LALTFEHTQADDKSHHYSQEQPPELEQPPPIYLVTDAVKSYYTKKGYRSAFNEFLKTTVKSQDLGALLDCKPNVIESKIINYIDYLKKRNLSSSSIKMKCSAIFHFFEINDVTLNTRKIKRFVPEDKSDNYSVDRPYSISEIIQILSKCDIRSRVPILLMASTGMRIGALRELRLGDLKKIDEFNLYMFWVYSRSKTDKYFTFCTPECAAAIDVYLDYRKSFGEELKDKSPLIREQFNIENPLTVKAPKPLSSRMMSHIFDDALKRAGVNMMQPGQKRRAVMSSHGLRKFFITECDKANIPFTVRELLSGHKLPHQDEHYNFRTEEEVLAEYVKAIPLLTFDPSIKLQEKVKELEQMQLKSMDEYHEEWLARLKQDYSLIKIEEWNALKSELVQIKSLLPPDFNQVIEWHAKNPNTGVIVRYATKIPFPSEGTEKNTSSGEGHDSCKKDP